MATTTTTSSTAAAAPSSKSSKIVFCTMQSSVLLLVLIDAVSTVAWLVLNPRPPAFRLDSLSLSSLPNAFDASFLPPKVHVQIQLNASNPNRKLDLVIQDVNLFLALIHRKHWLPLLSHHDTSSSGYYISKWGCQVLVFEIEAGLRPGRRTRRKRSFQFTVDKDLRKGSAVMSLTMKVSVMFTRGYLPSKRVSVEVAYGDLSIGFRRRDTSGRIARFTSLNQQKLTRKLKLFIITFGFSNLFM